jgi:hypothetical protein
VSVAATSRKRVLSRGRRRARERVKALPPGSEPSAAAVAQAGDLLALEALDATGLAVTSEGAFVRILRVTPPNAQLLSGDDRLKLAHAYCNLLSRLKPAQTVQFYIDSRPMDLQTVLDASAAEVAHYAGPFPKAGEDRDDLDMARWRLWAGMKQSLQDNAHAQSAMEVNAYLVVPYVPVGDAAPPLGDLFRMGHGKLPTARLTRDAEAHQRAVRASLALVENLRAELDALGMPVRLLNGQEVAELLLTRFSPTSTDKGRGLTLRSAELFGTLDQVSDPEAARRAAMRLRDDIARSHIDFSDPRQVEVEEDLAQSVFVQGTAGATFTGWLLDAMSSRQPFSLSVFVHPLDRKREKAKFNGSARRQHGTVTGAMSRGRAPNPERELQLAETQALLGELAGSSRTTIYQVAIYLTLRARGPRASAAELAEAVEYCSEALERAADCTVNVGSHLQQQLWISSLPLGRDVAKRVKRYVTRNVGDTVPFLGAGCGSPKGLAFAFGAGGKGLILLDPYDRTHANSTMMVTAMTGQGKTNTAFVLLARAIALGARASVIDRAGHYANLTHLIPGGSRVDIGADDSPHAINPWDVDDPSQPPGEKIQFLVALHGLMRGEEGLSLHERSYLSIAIRAVYARAAILGLRPRERMLVEELRAMEDREREPGGDQNVASMLRFLADCLGEYCGDGTYAYLLDRDTNVPVGAPLTVFDTRKCPDLVLRPVMFAVMEHIKADVQRHRDANVELASRPDAPMFAGKYICLIDEAWHIVARTEIGEYANDLARRARHLGLFLIVMSQSLQDFDTPQGRALIENCTMQLLLAQTEAAIPFVTTTLGLSPQEAWMLGKIKTVKGDYAQAMFRNGKRGKGIIELRHGPVEAWMSTSEPHRDRPRRDQMILECGGDVWAAIMALAAKGGPEIGQ